MKSVSLILIISILFLNYLPLFSASNPDELYNDILKTYKSGDYVKCIDLSKKFIKTYKTDERKEQVLMILGIAFAKIGNTEKAVKILKYHDKKFPEFNKNDKIELLLGKLYYNTKDYNNAEDILNKLISIHKDSKYVPTAEAMLAKIRNKNSNTGINKNKITVSKVPAKSQTEYSWRKITWAKIGAGICLIAAPVFYLLGNSAQETADSIYNNDYLNASTSDDAVLYYNQAVDNDEKAALYNNLAIASFIAGAGFFAFDYFSLSRINISATHTGSLRIQYSHGF